MIKLHFHPGGFKPVNEDLKNPNAVINYFTDNGINTSKRAAFIRFKYAKEISTFIKDLPAHYYIPEIGRWEIDSESFKMLIQKCKESDWMLTEDVRKKPEIKKEQMGFVFNKNDIKVSLFDHQKEAIDYFKMNNRFILGDEQGLGKTLEITAMAMARKRTVRAKHCLIVTCINGLKYNWKEEIEKTTNEKAYILGTRMRKNGNEYIGGNKEKLEDIMHLPKEYFLIINIESLRYKEGPGRGKYVIANKLAEYCQNGTIDMVAVDEIHKSNNPYSKQTRALLKLKPNCRIAATGTLITNNPLDSWVPLSWIGKEERGFQEFKDNFAVMGGFGMCEVIGYKNLEELNAEVASCMLRRKKQDVLGLPPKMRRIEYVELSKEEKKYYDIILKQTEEKIKAISNNKKSLSVDNALTKFIYLREVTGHAGILFNDFNESSKFERCKELVKEYVDNGEKVVIFSQWTSITDRLAKELKDYKPVLITGNVKSDERQGIVRRFQTDDSCKVIIGTSGAMGTGLTLTAANNVIFMDSPWTKALKEQCEDRCHRIGTKGTVNIVTLVAKNTIDEYIERIVYSKGELSDMVVDKDSEDVSNIPVMMKWLKSHAKL